MGFLGVNEDKLGAAIVSDLKNNQDVINGAAAALGAALGAAIIKGLFEGIPALIEKLRESKAPAK